MIEPPAHPSRLVYLGTPDDAVPPLQRLVAEGWPIDLVVSRPDKRRRRNKAPEPSPVKAAAIDLGLAVTDRLEDVVDTDADLGVVVAFGRIISAEVLAQLPMINLHFSLLPRWRGAAPVERAILAGDEATGVGVMQVVEGLDEGAVYEKVVVPVGQATVSELRRRLVSEGAELLVKTLAEGLTTPVEQRGEVTYAAKIESDDLHLDWSAPSGDLLRVIRLERAWTTFRGERLRVLAARADEGRSLPPGTLDGTAVGTGGTALVLDEVQPAGRAAMVATDWANGARLQPDERMGGEDQ